MKKYEKGERQRSNDEMRRARRISLRRSLALRPRRVMTARVARLRRVVLFWERGRMVTEGKESSLSFILAVCNN